MRLFLALETPEPLRAEIWRRVDSDRAALAGARWVRAEGVHLTLEFLGDVVDTAVGALLAGCRAACAGCIAFRTSLNGAGWFPPRRPARALWVGLEANPDLLRLQERVAAAARCARGASAAPLSRPFHPHLTLARCDPPWPRERARRFVDCLAAVAGWPFPVSEAVLMRSDLGRGGSRYQAIERFPLGGAA